MKKLIAGVLILIFCLFQGAFALEKEPFDMPVKQLYSAPTDASNIVFEIPIEVKLLDISEDNNWYKVKISYWVGPFSFTYVGWAPIPVGQIMAEREEAELAALLAEE